MRSGILIIGGGVIGLSIARELHRRGASDITILEKGRCGEEASWAAAGMLSPQVDADKIDPFFRLCCESRDLYPDFVSQLESETGIGTEFDGTGTLCVAFSDESEQILEKRFEWQSRLGLAVEKLSASEARRFEPSLNPAVRSSVRFARDWQIDNRKLLGALKNYALQANGIDILENTPVERLETDGSRAIGVTSSKGFIAAESIILATGAWSSLIDISGTRMPFDVLPVRGQIVAFRPREATLRHVIYGPDGYVLPRADGRVLAGATSENVGFNKLTTDEAGSQLWEMSSTILPTLRDQKIVDEWCGLRPRSADEMPLIGDVGIEGLTIATGHYRNGILLAPVTANIVADAVLSGVHSHYLNHFSPTRFLSNRACIAKV